MYMEVVKQKNLGGFQALDSCQLCMCRQWKPSLWRYHFYDFIDSVGMFRTGKWYFYAFPRSLHISFQGATCTLPVYLANTLFWYVFSILFNTCLWKIYKVKVFPGPRTVLSNYVGFLKIIEFFRLQYIHYCKQQLRFHLEVMEETGI